MFRTLGETISVKSRSWIGPAAPRRTVLGIDIILLLSVFTLLVFGLLMVYSASWDDSIQVYGNPTTIFFRQLLFALSGLLVIGWMTMMDYHHWQKLALPAIAATLVLLAIVLAIGEVRNNAVRTLVGGSIQPSELAKLVAVIYLSAWMYSKREQLSSISFGLAPLAAILGIIGGLIFLQPDLSAVITIFFLGGVMFFFAGGEWKKIILLVIAAGVIGYLVVQFTPTGRERLAFYLAGWQDPTEGSYHIQRSLEAFVKGGWFGVGIGKSSTKMTGLPFPSTDSIFAVVGEETGAFGSIGLVVLYGLLLWRGLTIAIEAPDQFGRLLAGGLSLWIAWEAFVNMAVMLSLMPFAGNALPFLSAGGSNLWVSMAAVGILMNVSRQSEKSKQEKGRLFGAVVDLRRRDRGRRVSRPRRMAGTG
jgi:cell division protein FtsW